jgi:hypothetical protein
MLLRALMLVLVLVLYPDLISSHLRDFLIVCQSSLASFSKRLIKVTVNQSTRKHQIMRASNQP